MSINEYKIELSMYWTHLDADMSAENGMANVAIAINRISKHAQRGKIFMRIGANIFSFSLAMIYW